MRKGERNSWKSEQQTVKEMESTAGDGHLAPWAILVLHQTHHLDGGMKDKKMKEN